MSDDLSESEQKASLLSAEDIWRQEAEARLLQIERGEAQLVSAADVFDRLQRRVN
ncbi:addiction module protein [Undibacterium crateris]|uniref:addiction module protein n=1 Tax=Undibacterium crateris TaxID=2528175 RepID=UPI0013894F35|nr:addiction module protein [Undibacterium crateris]NDI85193.1 hypothetical protein [Undibacterium crateris]